MRACDAYPHTRHGTCEKMAFSSSSKEPQRENLLTTKSSIASASYSKIINHGNISTGWLQWPCKTSMKLAVCPNGSTAPLPSSCSICSPGTRVSWDSSAGILTLKLVDHLLSALTML